VSAASSGFDSTNGDFMMSLHRFPMGRTAVKPAAPGCKSLIEPKTYISPNDMPAIMIEMLIRVQRAINSDRALASELVDGVVHLLRVTVDGDAAVRSRRAGGMLTPWQMRRVTTYIDANLHRTLTAAELADIAHLSRSYFSRAFKRSFGTAPHGYIMAQRALRAQQMMLTTEQPLGQIAIACGMVGQSQFCKMFRRTVGNNPLAWRRMFKTKIHQPDAIEPQLGIIPRSPQPSS
jgi:AraC family transcriptional regulator